MTGWSPVASADGTRLPTEAVGPVGAPVVLLLHGVGSSRRFLLEAFAPPATTAGWRLVVADLRGHGDATPVRDPAGHAHARHVEDVLALAERHEPSVVGGVSLGSHAAVGAVTAGLDCRAVLACLPAWTGRAVPGTGPHAVVAAEVRRVGTARMVERFRDDTQMTPWLREVLLRDWPRHDPASLAAALVALDGGVAPMGRELATLRVPLALVGWPDDPAHPLPVARGWQRAAPRGHLATTSLGAVDRDRTALGAAAMRALAALGVHPTADGAA